MESQRKEIGVILIIVAFLLAFVSVALIMQGRTKDSLERLVAIIGLIVSIGILSSGLFLVFRKERYLP